MICCSNLRKPSPATHPNFNCIRLFPSQRFQMHLHLKKCLLFLLSFQYFGSRRKYPTSPYMEFSVVFQFLPFLLFGEPFHFPHFFRIYDDFTHSFQVSLSSLLSSPSSLLMLYSGYVRGRTTASCAALRRERGKREFETLWTTFAMKRNKILKVVYPSLSLQ